MEDIKCKDCGEFFTFTDADKRFYEEKNFTKPLRCKPCRAIKKQKFESQQYGSRYETYR